MRPTATARTIRPSQTRGFQMKLVAQLATWSTISVASLSVLVSQSPIGTSVQPRAISPGPAPRLRQIRKVTTAPSAVRPSASENSAAE